MFLSNASRTGAGTDTILSVTDASQIQKLWNFTTGGVVAPSVSVVNESINGTPTEVAYVGSWDGNEYALNANTGSLIWKTSLGITSSAVCKSPSTAGISSAAAIYGGVLYVGGGDSNWYALDPAKGTILWSIPTGDNNDFGTTHPNGGHYNWSSPVLYRAGDGNDYAYIGVSSFGDCPLVEGQIIQVNVSTHQVVHTFDVVPKGHVGGGIWTSPSIDPTTNTLYATTGTIVTSDSTTAQQYSEAIISLDATTMGCTAGQTVCTTAKDVWQLPASARVNDSDWGTTPTIFDDENGNHLVSATNKNGVTYAWNRNNLRAGPVWQRRIATGGICPTCGDGSVSSSAFDDTTKTLFVSGGHTTIGGVNYNGSVRALDPASGTIKWEHGTASPVIGALAFDNGLVVDAGGRVLEVLNSATGAHLFTYSTGGTIYGAPSVADGEIFAGSVDKNVYAFGIPGSPPPPPPTCPTGWSCTDIGAPTPTGTQAINADGTWTVSGGGGDIWDTADHFHFVSQPMTNNNSISARLISQAAGNQCAKAGVMMRSTTDPGSPEYSLLYTPGGGTGCSAGLRVQYRATSGSGSPAGLTTLLATQTGTLPAYVQVADTADKLTAYTSADGVTWTPIPNSTVAAGGLGPSILGGVAVTSHDTASLSSANVGAVVVGSTAPPPPGCPPGWSCADVGLPANAPAGSEQLTGGTWTISGSGGDIWISADQFHYVYHVAPQFGMPSSPAMVTARVTSQTNTNAWAKAGVMFRVNPTDPSSPEYAFLVTPTPSHGLEVQYRGAEGGTTLRIATLSPAQTLPAYIRVSFDGTNCSAYTSPDGTTWTLVPGSTIAFAASATLYEGLAVTSHSVPTLSTVTMDTVTAQ